MKAMVRIFLSYAGEDEEKVENLYRKLSEAGFKPWMDKKDILPGEKWPSSIRRAIGDSDFFLVCLSTNSVQKRGWVQREQKQALDLWQEKLEDDIYLIPVRLEDCESPESLRDFQWVNLFEENGWTRLVEAIQVGMERRGEAVQPVAQEPALFGSYPAYEKSLPAVLLVDDEADWLRICSKRLPQTHYTLKMSISIESALRLLSAETFAVVVADICMPGARGLGGLEILSKTKIFRPETRRVMITAYAGGLKDITDEALTKKLADNFVEKKNGFQELDNCIMYEVDCWKQKMHKSRKHLEEESDSSVYEQEAKGDLEPPKTSIWTPEMQRESWESQLAQHRRNLAKLEERAAEYGSLDVPLEIDNAIEKEKRAISELASKLRGLEGDNF